MIKLVKPVYTRKPQYPYNGETEAELERKLNITDSEKVNFNESNKYAGGMKPPSGIILVDEEKYADSWITKGSGFYGWNVNLVRKA